ncbi:MAG TPA: hypothetical protein VHE54_04015 [Puia sp.]|nr:hypothetical protein [Puia sp.]
MKAGKFMLLTGLCAIGFASPVLCQQTLPGVTVIAANYKYLKTVGGKQVVVPVTRLQRTAASYDVKNSEYYEEDYDTYFISFILPEGQILAAYDANGKLLRTAEKYKDIRLPAAVTNAVVSRFPNWSIAKDVYIVNYYDQNGGNAQKKYKLLLQNGTKRIRVQVNENGEF